MGTWRIEHAIYGEQERWIPAFTGDWPADLDPTNRSPSLGILPPLCRKCGGELTRRTVTPDANAIAFHRARAEQRLARQIAEGHDPVPLPPPETPMRVTQYDVACYRGPHRLTSRGGDGVRGGAPERVGAKLELVPAMRTTDWANR